MQHNPLNYQGIMTMHCSMANSRVWVLEVSEIAVKNIAAHHQKSKK